VIEDGGTFAVGVKRRAITPISLMVNDDPADEASKKRRTDLAGTAVVSFNVTELSPVAAKRVDATDGSATE
jgi:hypothetical protein